VSSGVTSSREANKRRLMFVPGEDFYFLVYTTLIVLDNLKCASASHEFSDLRKIAYLADLLGSDADLHLSLTTAPLGQSGRARLALLYDRAATRHLPLERIGDALARRGLVTFARKKGEPDRLFIANPETVTALLKSSLFDAERRRIGYLRRYLPQLRTMTLGTLKTRLFANHGVNTWGD